MRTSSSSFKIVLPARSSVRTATRPVVWEQSHKRFSTFPFYYTRYSSRRPFFHRGTVNIQGQLGLSIVGPLQLIFDDLVASLIRFYVPVQDVPWLMLTTPSLTVRSLEGQYVLGLSLREISCYRLSFCSQARSVAFNRQAKVNKKQWEVWSPNAGLGGICDSHGIYSLLPLLRTPWESNGSRRTSCVGLYGAKRGSTAYIFD